MTFWDNQSLDRVFYELREAIRTLETQSPLRSSSITEGRLRVGGSAILLIDSDGGVVIEGRLTGNGTFKWTTLAEFTGEFKSTGPALFDGDVEITKTLDVTASTKLRGLVELLNDLSVAAGGKILVGTTMRIVPSTDGGSVEFVDGSRLSSSGGTTGIRAGSSRLEISDAFARMSISGRGFTINSGGYQMTSLPTAPVSSYPGGFVNAVVADAAGNLRRLVA